MNKLLLTLLACTPIFANAASIQFTPTGSNFLISNYGLTPNTTGARNVGQFGSLSIAGAGAGTLTATYLGSDSGFSDNFSITLGSGPFSLNEGTVGNSVSGQITGPGLINFGFFSSGGSGQFGQFNNGQASNSNLGFVILKQLATATDASSVASTGFDNTTTLGSFDFLLGFNDVGGGDADYDDYVVGLKFQPAISSVPAPAAFPLLASAIGFFGLRSNRKRL